MGALFLIESGECIAGPCAGQSLTALPGREDEQGIVGRSLVAQQHLQPAFDVNLLRRDPYAIGQHLYTCSLGLT